MTSRELLWPYFRAEENSQEEKDFGRQFDRTLKPSKPRPLQRASWAKRHPDLARTKRTEWKAANPEKHRLAQKLYRERNKEKVSKWKLAWKLKNPEKVKAARDKWRASKQSCLT